MLLGLSYLLPLLKATDALIKFAQGKDVFIYDFVVAVKIYLANLYMMYFDPSSNYQWEHLQVFSNVVENNFATIIQDRVTNINNGMETLAFHMVGHNYVTHIFNPLIKVKQHVCKVVFETHIM
jgi:hypothetical protein